MGRTEASMTRALRLDDVTDLIEGLEGEIGL
jgi:hypothetical protein